MEIEQKKTVEEALTALDQIKESAETIGLYGRSKEKNKSVFFGIANVDQGEETKAAIAYVGSPLNITYALIRAMQESPEVEKAVNMAAMLSKLGI